MRSSLTDGVRRLRAVRWVVVRKGKTPSARSWVAALAVLAGVSASCNALVDTNVEQCRTTADCVAKGGPFVNAVCTPERVCSLGGDCLTNQECIDRFDGQLAICRKPDRSCVALRTADCQDVFPEAAIADDDTLLLGVLAPLRGEFASSGIPPWEGVQLAVNELDKFGNGLPIPGSAARRRVAFLACHDLDDHLRAARHLAQVVRVGAIVGPQFSGITLDVANKVTIPAGTLIISPSATSTAITDLQDNGLVWRTAPSDAIQAIPLAHVVTEIEARVRAQLNLAATDRIRVAVTVKGDAYGLGLASAVLGQLQFNGQPALGSQNAPFFLRSDYPDPSDQPSYDFAALVESLVAFQPHITLLLGTTESVTKVLAGIESQWTSANRPVYVLGDGGRDEELLPMIGATPALAQRVVGTLPGRTTALFAQFASSYKGFHQNKDPGSYADTAYDAAYLLAYAAVAAGKSQLTGSDFNAGLKKMVGGTKVPSGPDGINSAFKLLGEQASIDFDGVSGPLDFDVSTGEAPSDIVVWCTEIDAGNKPTFVTSGQYYDSIASTMVGTRAACAGLVGD